MRPRKKITAALIAIKQRSLWRYSPVTQRNKQRYVWLRSAVSSLRRISLVLSAVCLGVSAIQHFLPISELGTFIQCFPAIFAYICMIFILRKFDFSIPNKCTLEKPASKINLFVQGAGTRSIHLRVDGCEEVAEIFKILRRRHILPDSLRVGYFAFFPPYSLGILEPCLTLQDIGVHNLSTLYIRAKVLGGTRAPTEGLAAAVRFTAQTGYINSDSPTTWQALTGEYRGYFSCRICGDEEPHHRSYLRAHETTRAHRNHLRIWNNMHSPDNQPAASSSRLQPTNIDIRTPLADVLGHYPHDSGNMPPTDLESNEPMVDWDSGVFTSDISHKPAFEEATAIGLFGRLRAYLDDEDGAESMSDSSAASANPEDHSDNYPVTAAADAVWYPWPNRETCVLDILRHVPRCAFSQKQNAVIHWALCALGMNNVPSERTMNAVDKTLQKICGIESIRYSGALGHLFYVNDFAATVAQEMANPRVRPHLRFLPEDSGKRLSEAWQASRWLKELNGDLTTPMMRHTNQDFYIYEIALCRDGKPCMPVRWFTRGHKTMCKAWGLAAASDGDGWIVHKHNEFDIDLHDLLVSQPHLVETHRQHGIPDPRKIFGFQDGISDTQVIHPWTETDPHVGNRWRKLAAGHRVCAFPIWLYCDDTSGNLSKKWNKHNSFLFTAAGLPRRLVHREFNIHFLCTSNIAPPLEMLDGIVDQLRDCQKHGIWAWDSELKEMVLIIPSVLAMLGDNPMQSEIACHIGLMGRFFCRVCWVSNNSSVSPTDWKGTGDNAGEPEVDGEEGDDASIASLYSESEDKGEGIKKRGKKTETMAEMIDRVKKFMAVNRIRSKSESINILASQFENAKHVGGKTKVIKARTATGIKDTFQSFFIDKLFSISTKQGRQREQKERDLATYSAGLPSDEHTTSPVWRIKDFDPHTDTPVEILHVILLGFVKYFWRDAVARLKDHDKLTLIARLSSFDVRGLGISRLAGRTLVTYAGSLTGRDFRALVQAAPFVLQGLPGIPHEAMDVWASLAVLVSQVWQPEIEDVDIYITELEAAINYFLDCTCQFTPRWFNKPKFHILLHLPEHIRRFGPPMLFATEGFESFNAVIRSYSIHSNRHAPSRDIAHGMARSSRVRHLLSSGYFILPDNTVTNSEPESESHITGTNKQISSAWIQKTQNAAHNQYRWVQAGSGSMEILKLRKFASQILAFEDAFEGDQQHVVNNTGLCGKAGALKPWAKTKASKTIAQQPLGALYRIPEEVLIENGEWCKAEHWVIYRQSSPTHSAGNNKPSILLGRIIEIIQYVGSVAERDNCADTVYIEECTVGEEHPNYRMPRISLSGKKVLTPISNIYCTANVQHNCVENACLLENSRHIFQEREKTQKMASEVKHRYTQSSNYILNLGQMRDAARMAVFRISHSVLKRDEIIQRASLHEVEQAKQRRKQQTKAKGKEVERLPPNLNQVHNSQSLLVPSQQCSPHPVFPISQDPAATWHAPSQTSSSFPHHPHVRFPASSQPIGIRSIVPVSSAHPTPLLSDPRLSQFRHFSHYP